MAWYVCIIRLYEWKIIPLHGKTHFKIERRKTLYYWKLLQTKACRYDMPSLVCLKEVMTLMYLIVVL